MALDRLSHWVIDETEIRAGTMPASGPQSLGEVNDSVVTARRIGLYPRVPALLLSASLLPHEHWRNASIRRGSAHIYVARLDSVRCHRWRHEDKIYRRKKFFICRKRPADLGYTLENNIKIVLVLGGEKLPTGYRPTGVEYR